MSIHAILILALSALAVGAALEPASQLTTRTALLDSCESQLPLICNVQATAGNSVTGAIIFTPAVVRVRNRLVCRARVQATVRNLTPGAHGFHIHMYGDLSAENGLSTGPHFLNPRGIPVEHGFSSDRIRHWGDLDNLIADEEGVAVYDRVDRVIRLRGILGRGITIHADEDLGAEFQPTGNAGARIGVCTIGFANPSSLQ